MKSLKRSIITAAAAALAVAGCTDSPAQPDGPITVTVAVSRSAVRAGDSTTVSVTTTNTGSATVAVAAAECPTQFEVRKNATTVAPGMSDICPAVYAPRSLGPGQSLTTNYVWYGDNQAWAVLLNPGNYTLRGKVYVGEELMRSAEIPVTIL